MVNVERSTDKRFSEMTFPEQLCAYESALAEISLLRERVKDLEAELSLLARSRDMDVGQALANAERYRERLKVSADAGFDVSAKLEVARDALRNAIDYFDRLLGDTDMIDGTEPAEFYLMQGLVRALRHEPEKSLRYEFERLRDERNQWREAALMQVRLDDIGARRRAIVKRFGTEVLREED